jgi:hypothetical protein
MNSEQTPASPSSPTPLSPAKSKSDEALNLLASWTATLDQAEGSRLREGDRVAVLTVWGGARAPSPLRPGLLLEDQRSVSVDVLTLEARDA